MAGSQPKKDSVVPSHGVFSCIPKLSTITKCFALQGDIVVGQARESCKIQTGTGLLLRFRRVVAPCVCFPAGVFVCFVNYTPNIA